jgi:hypothetical protein
MSLLSRSEVKDAPDVKPYPFAVPEWGGSVLLRPLMCWEREEWEREQTVAQEQGMGAPQHNIARLVRRGLLNPDGSYMYGEGPADLKELASKSGAALGRLFREIAGRAGLTKDAQEQAEKNSGPTQPDDGSSGSA